MAFCQVCGKTKQYGHNVSHSKRRTKRVFMPNVFRKRMFLSTAAGSRSKARDPKELTSSDPGPQYQSRWTSGRYGASRETPDGGGIKRVKICAKCLKRAKRYGEVEAKDGAVLGGMLVKVVDWEKIVYAKVEKKHRSEEEEKKEKEKKEISVEELVGRNKSAKKI